jgi:Ca-activated chloride channel homolog
MVNLPMTFIWPTMLLLLLLMPLCVGLYILQLRRRRRLAASYGSLGFGQEAARSRPGLRRHIPPGLFLLSLAILILALARPEAVVNLPRVEGTVILAFDISGSMAADDLKPTRMEAAKAAARNFVQLQPRTVQVGVVAFSDGGFSVQAPTNDQEAILATIDRLTPQRGTSLGHGILSSLNTIIADAEKAQPVDSDPTSTPLPPDDDPMPLPEGMYRPAVIVLLTDGENTDAPHPLEAAQAAADEGVRIYTIGIGSEAGTTLQVEGFTVHTRLDEAMLQQISQLTGGAYYNAENEQDLQNVYRNLEPQLVVKPEKMEVTSILAGAGILAMLLGGTFSVLWFNRLP